MGRLSVSVSGHRYFSESPDRFPRRAGRILDVLFEGGVRVPGEEQPVPLARLDSPGLPASGIGAHTSLWGTHTRTRAVHHRPDPPARRRSDRHGADGTRAGLLGEDHRDHHPGRPPDPGGLPGERRPERGPERSHRRRSALTPSCAGTGNGKIRRAPRSSRHEMNAAAALFRLRLVTTAEKPDEPASLAPELTEEVHLAADEPDRTGCGRKARHARAGNYAYVIQSMGSTES
ncbi:hypothetical protein ACSDR0_45855 [Streptosporangium sp. G11]|uniref:hypothetical protein n=1 Tax=Streptosporangium sp. G11 TaxID=3436926 RepID=UPI003EC0486A